MRSRLLIGLVVAITWYVYWRGFQAGEMHTLKTAYEVYKKEVPWECS